MCRTNVLRVLAVALDVLGVGFFVASHNSAREPEPERAPLRPGVVKTVGVPGVDFWGSSVSGYSFGNSLLTFTRDNRWFGFLRDRASELDGELPERGHPLEKQLLIYDLTGPAKVPIERLNAGHGPLASGPHGSIAFYVEDPFQERQLFFPNAAPAPGGNPAALPEMPEIPEYVAVHWCETGRTAYYRLPKYSGHRIRSQGPIRELWFGTHPRTKAPCLFALRIDGLLCMWELRDGGRPPQGNLRVQDQPRVINLLTPFRRDPPNGNGTTLSMVLDVPVAPNVGALAFRDLEAAAPRVLTLWPYASRTLQPVPGDAAQSDHTELLLSPDARYCLRLSEHPGEAKVKAADLAVLRGPNVLHMWNAQTGTFLWRQALPDTHFVSRAAFRPDGLRFVTWSRSLFSLFAPQYDDVPVPVPGNVPGPSRLVPTGQKKIALPEEGTLHLWDSAKGTVIGTLPFALQNWPDALRFTPDGAQVVVLTKDGVCHFVDTKAFKASGE